MKADGSPHCPPKGRDAAADMHRQDGNVSPREILCAWHSIFRIKITSDFKPKAYNRVIINVDQDNSLSISSRKQNPT